jgi:AcrR family transcriptional regulator
MTKANKQLKGSAYDRILDVATDLFYTQGYRATGINEIIEKSGVAKATFYNHFPSKDQLCAASLKWLMANEINYVENAIANSEGPLDRFLAAITSLKAWAISTEFRGCAFMNISAEIPEPSNPLRKIGTKLYDEIRNRVEQLANELIESNTKKYGHLDASAITKDYMIIFAGAVGLMEIYHAIWPVEHAEQTMRRLIGE